MLMDILMESLMSMDEDTLDYVLESCSDEEIDIIDDMVMEMQIPDRTNSAIKKYHYFMNHVRRATAGDPTTNHTLTMTAYKDPNSSYTNSDRSFSFTPTLKKGEIYYEKKRGGKLIGDGRTCSARDVTDDVKYVTKKAATYENQQRVKNAIKKIAQAPGKAIDRAGANTARGIEKLANKIGK